MIRNSPEHIRAVAEIDTRFFKLLVTEKQQFKKRTKMSEDALEDDPEWLAITGKVEEKRIGELWLMKQSVTDS